MNSRSNRLVILEVGLFPDKETVDSAVYALAGDHDIQRHDLTDTAMDTAAWDQVVIDILSAQKVITV